MKTIITVARFVGCVKETCHVGGSVSLRGLYEIPNPDGSVARLYERHTSQIRGMGWNPTTATPTHGRVWSWIGYNGYRAAVGAHVMLYDGPETVEVSWRPCHEVMAENAAVLLVGRAHIPSNLRGIKNLMEPACTVAEAMSPYTEEKFPGWSLNHDTGHGKATPCANLSEQVAQETLRINREFDELLNKELVSRAEWPETRDGRTYPTFFCLKDTDNETITRAIGFNCGISPDYHVPQGWVPSSESCQQLAQLRAEKARLDARAKEIQQHFLVGWGILRERYQIAFEKLGLTIGEDNRSLQNGFRIGANNSQGRYAECPAGGKNGPHSHTSYSEVANWLDENATTYDVADTAAHLLEKMRKAAK